MRQQKLGARIAENPTTLALYESMPLIHAAKSITGALKRIGVSNSTVDAIHESASSVVRQSDLLELPDEFNHEFSDQGWIATSSMAVDTMRRAVDLQRNGSHEEAQREILDWFNEDNINLFAITRSKRFDATGKRWFQLREALQLTVEARYWAAVPLILIACDGFASDVVGTSPFRESADLTAFDSIVGHPSSLPSLIAQITKGVRKSTSADLTLPLRHGILHGRSLGYANRVVCMKAWMLMIALVDWACDKSSEDERVRKHRATKPPDWAELRKRLLKTRKDRQAIDAYQPRTNFGPFNHDMSAELPEFAILQFLTYWQAQNYGHMAGLVLNFTQQTKGRLAGELRQTGELVRLSGFSLRSVRQSTVAMAEADVYLEGVTPDCTVHGNFKVVSSRITDSGDVAMPTDQGRWYVRQSCIIDLLRGRTIESTDSV